MPLTAGTPLGPYEILAPIGAGGMGEVYRARDTRLGREVALKVIAAGTTTDAERLARFEQEARATAALNHPNILAVHDIGQSEHGPFIVSELLEGDTLRERLARGRVPARTALEIGAQIARGLAAAHDKGVVHRDLKPDNIFLTKDGTAKILDFGLAKLHGDEPSLKAAAAMATATVQSPVNTQPGVVMGTVGYMAPEQVRGEPVDHRADIFAIGCVLYELLNGQRAFSGASPIETMHAILTADPPEVVASGGALMTPGAERIVRRCVEKEASRRFQSARDLAFALEAVAESGSSGMVATAARPPASGIAARAIPWILATALGSALGFTLWPGPTLPVLPRIQFDIETPATNGGNQIALSPAGTHLVAMVSENGGMLWVRDLETLAEQTLLGTEGATWPFWSADGRTLAFFAGGRLKRVDRQGGPPVTLADVTGGTGGTWNSEGVIVFAPDFNGPLFRVPAAGGVAAPLTSLDLQRGEFAHRHPRFLPDGRHFIYVASSSNNEDSGIYVASLDSPGARLLVRTPFRAAFAPPDWLLFMRDTTLMAQHLDPDRLELSAVPFPVAEGLSTYLGTSAAGFTVADNGMVAYRISRGAGPDTSLRWFDRQGRSTAAVELPAAYQDPALSPDGRRVVVGKVVRTGTGGGAADLWMIDLQRGTETRFTSNVAHEESPRWSPDGDQVAFSRTRGSGSDVYIKSAHGAAPEEVVSKGEATRRPADFSQDGQFLLYFDYHAMTLYDLWTLPLRGNKKPEAVVRTSYNDNRGRFSPDGKWVAYVSTESDRAEVYVIGFPTARERIQISTTGGDVPRWQGDGKELFFSNGTAMMAVDISVSVSGALQAGVPHKLFDVRVVGEWDVSRDGERFLINVGTLQSTGDADPIRVILNWAPTGKR